MQLQKRLNRKVGDKEYSKWVVVIPPETIQKLGWGENEELAESIEGKRLTLEPATRKAQSHSDVQIPRRAKKLG